MANFVAVIAHPTTAYVLLLMGMYGLILEAFHPGTYLPGIVGTICLLLGLYALQGLPVNYAGLALMAVGVGLLIVESISPTVGALGIAGVAAFVFGSTILFNTSVPGYAVNRGVIGGIGFCAIVLLALILWLVLRSRRARVRAGDQQLLDTSGELLEATDATGDGWARINGERWQIRADEPLPAGAHVRVVRRDGLVLWVVRA